MHLRPLAAGLLLAGAAFAACNPYDLTLHDRFEQGGFNANVDVVWVVDNSESMRPIQQAVQDNFGAFIDAFANVGDEDGTELDYDTVADATVAWSEFLLNRERFLNYNMGVTTTDIESSGNGNQGNLRSRADLGGNTCDDAEVLTPSSENPVEVFRDLVDVGIAGSGTEQGILASAFSLCKMQDDAFWTGLSDRPDTDPVKQICSRVPAAEQACNRGFSRAGASTVFIIVTDEGDQTWTHQQLPPSDWMEACRQAHLTDITFTDCDCRIQYFLDFFDAFESPVLFFDIGPTYQDQPVAWCDGTERDVQGPCNRQSSQPCGIDFYQLAACATGGEFTPIEVRPPGSDTCEAANFDEALTSIGRLISGLSRSWVLSAVPDVETITVLQDNTEEVPWAGAGGSTGGWSYNPNERSIQFSSQWAPDYDTTVDVYYLPQFDRRDSVGRDFPY